MKFIFCWVMLKAAWLKVGFVLSITYIIQQFIINLCLHPLCSCCYTSFYFMIAIIAKLVMKSVDLLVPYTPEKSFFIITFKAVRY